MLPQLQHWQAGLIHRPEMSKRRHADGTLDISDRLLLSLHHTAEDVRRPKLEKQKIFPE